MQRRTAVSRRGEEGQVAKSQDPPPPHCCLAGLTGLLWLGMPIVDMLAGYWKMQLGGEAWLSTDPQFYVAHSQQLLYALACCLLPFLGLLMFVGIAANVLQVGFLFLPEKLAPDLMRLDPLQGLARLFSLANLMRLVMGLLKMALVTGVAYASLYGQREKVIGLSAMTTWEISAFLAQILIWTSMKIAVTLLVLSVLDYGFQWWKQQQDLRMTTQEVRDELKNLEANPQIVARRKQVQRQLALHRISTANLRDAVITNLTELAIAIQYDPEKMAADRRRQGAYSIAARIRKLAWNTEFPSSSASRWPSALSRSRDQSSHSPGPLCRRRRGVGVCVSIEGEEDSHAGVAVVSMNALAETWK